MTASWNWRRRLTFALLLAALAVGLVASDGGAAQPQARASAAKTVDINHFAFHPPTLRIQKGGSVTFANSSKIAHTATRGGSFNTGHIKPGKSVTVNFGEAGTFAYHCNIHPFMKGKIVVE